MKRRALFLLLIGLLFVPRGSLAQDNTWTCDGGPNDALNAAQAAYDAGDLERALELARTAEEMCGNGPNINMGRYPQAAGLLLKTPTPVPTPASTDADAQRALELFQQGVSFCNTGQYAQALSMFELALPIYQQIGPRESEADVLTWIGVVYGAQGQYAQALDYYVQALAIFHEVNDWQSEEVALENIHYIGVMSYNAGQYTEALAAFEEELTVYQQRGDRASVGVTLSNIGVVYGDQRQYTEALDYFSQALDIAREVGDRAGESQILKNIGVICHLQEQYAQALEYYTQALDIMREVGDRAGEGTILNSIGQVYDSQGRYTQALDAYTQALNVAREVGDRTLEGTTLGNIGVVYGYRGEYAQALDYFIQALDIRHEVGDRLGEGTTLNNIGGVYGAQGQYAQALDYFNQALDIEREIGDRAGEGATLNGIGGVYSDQGQYAQALDYYTQALDIVREVGDRSGEGTALGSIGGVYRAQGQYAQALDYFQQALDIAQEIGDRAGEGAALHNIGGVYRDQGQYAQAMEYYTQALDILRTIGDRAGEGAALHNIGGVYGDQGQYAQALDYYQQALEIVREVGDRNGEGRALTSIGAVYYSQGQYAQALEYDIQALDILRAIGDRAGEGVVLHNIGVVYSGQGQYTQTLDYCTQALAIRREIGDREGELITLSQRGVAYENLEQPTDAIPDYQAAVELIESILNDAALDSAIASLSSQLQNTWPYQRLVVLLVQQGDFKSALNYAERGRAILTRTDLTTAPIDFRAGLDETLLQQETTLRLAVNDDQNLLDSLRRDTSATNTDIQNAQAALHDDRQAYEDHLAVMQLQGGFLARQISREVATLEQIQASLPADTTLVLYAVGNPNSVVFLVTADSLDAVVLDVSDDTLAEQVTTFASDRRANVDTFSTLYDLMFAPIADRLATSHLIIVPDGPLNYVPFAALQAPDGRYLVDDYAISMVSSATTLVLLNDRAQKTQTEPTSPGLVLAQPAAPGLPTLRFATLEVMDVADLLGVEPNLNATEADLRQGAPGSAVIHISAHAQLDRFAPLFSVIYLGASGDYDGRLEVREIYELDLSQGTELVVLSGCETASGGDGEDFGLMTRAFFAAGTPRVVASLWSVDDVATGDLLTAFIRERANTDNDADALRAAMLATRELYPEPYFWASFVLSGLP